MAKAALIFTPIYYEHRTGQDHPESPERLRMILKELRKAHLIPYDDRCRLMEPSAAPLEDLELVHSKEHIQLVRRMCNQGGGILDAGDTVVSAKSFQVAKYAVGGVAKAVDLVLEKKVKNAFALVRPPGHHAGQYYSAGFCIFSNVAIAAARLINKSGLERVLIIDFDAHHGNGTQEIFYDTAKVLYISLHEDPSDFPGTGFSDEIGAGEGQGYNVNIPFPLRSGNEGYLKALEVIAVPIIKQYAPQFILASVGFDGHFADPVGRLNLTSSAYDAIFEKILDCAANSCEGRFVAALEGGYCLSRLGELVVLAVSRMMGETFNVEEDRPREDRKAEVKAEKIIKKVREVQSQFWNLDR